MIDQTMVERVARTLMRVHHERGRGIAPTWDAIDQFQREAWLVSAQAAVTVMRAPTEAMVKEAWAAVGSNLRYEEVYRRMIDAALRD
jgi:hypothetical protein